MTDNHLAMSDEDFLKQAPPETGEPSSDAPQDTNLNTEDNKQDDPAQTPADPTQGADNADPGSAAKPDAAAENGADAGGSDPAKSGEPAATGSDTQGADDKKADQDPTKAGADAGASAAGSEPNKDAPKQEDKAPDYQAFYTEVMKPFTANGKEIKLRTPDEARQLMQMGANYTQKMQQLAPHRKLISMLTNNQVDEDKLSFLIDLDKKDPEAIKRLIKDSGIDPLDIDTSTEPAYQGGSHKVSDRDVAFQSELEELGSNPTGQQTLLEVEKTWDQSSKDQLWQQPGLLSVINTHRESGIYAKITEEIARQKTLGQLPTDKPFLEAYQVVGDALHNAGAFGDKPGSDAGKTAGQPSTTVDTPAAAKPDPTPVVTGRAAAPKADDDAAKKAGAAAPSRSAPGKTGEAVNFLSMSDEEFAKAAALKV